MEQPKWFKRTRDINIYDIILFIKKDGMIERKNNMEWFMKIKLM